MNNEAPAEPCAEPTLTGRTSCTPAGECAVRYPELPYRQDDCLREGTLPTHAPNPAYGASLAKLDHFVVLGKSPRPDKHCDPTAALTTWDLGDTGSEGDETIDPWQSELFGHYAPGSSPTTVDPNFIEWPDTDMVKSGLLPLKQMHDAGRLEVIQVPNMTHVDWVAPAKCGKDDPHPLRAECALPVNAMKKFYGKYL